MCVGKKKELRNRGSILLFPGINEDCREKEEAKQHFVWSPGVPSPAIRYGRCSMHPLAKRGANPHSRWETRLRIP